MGLLLDKLELLLRARMIACLLLAPPVRFSRQRPCYHDAMVTSNSRVGRRQMNGQQGLDPRKIRLLTPEEQAVRRAERLAREEEQRARQLDELATFDPFARDPGGRPRKEVPPHIAPSLWADARKVMAGEEGWGWRTVQRKYKPYFPFSIRWLRRVAQDGSLERMAAGT